MRSDSTNFLINYLSTYTPSGNEHFGKDVWLDESVKYADEIKEYSNGNITATLVAPNAKATIIVEAHMDEISWRISKIEDNGLIKLIRNGGSDSIVAPSKTGVIHLTTGEKIRGVFGLPAIHVREERDKGLKVKELFFDTGITKEKLLELGVRTGLTITFDDMPFFMGESEEYICGRALDNKLGGYILIETLKRLSSDIKHNFLDLSVNIVFANCIAEEVGLYGAKILAQDLKEEYKNTAPVTAALVVDVTHDTNVPTTNKDEEGEVECGKGPALEHSAQCHYKFTELLEKVMLEEKIEFQHSVGGFGNDTVSFYEFGIDSAILSIPLKYMHTTVEMAHLSDVENIVKSFVSTIKHINKNYSLNYEKFQHFN